MENTGHEASNSLTLFSQLCGWTYFTAWTISFYPQLIMNYRTKSTVGLSGAFACFNLIGFVALTLFDIIRYRIQEKYDLVSAVKDQDLCFAIHAVILCAACCLQVICYKSWAILKSPNVYLLTGVTALSVTAILHGIAAFVGLIPLTDYPGLNRSQYFFSIWTFTEFCAAVKLAITLSKYLPQILLNRNRQMTSGLAIWTFNLDCIGGVFSLLQNGIEAGNKRSMAYITGNIPKIGIGVIGLTYNAIILTQHYVLYNNPDTIYTKPSEYGVTAALITSVLSPKIKTMHTEEGLDEERGD